MLGLLAAAWKLLNHNFGLFKFLLLFFCLFFVVFFFVAVPNGFSGGSDEMTPLPPDIVLSVCTFLTEVL